MFWWIDAWIDFTGPIFVRRGIFGFVRTAVSCFPPLQKRSSTISCFAQN